MYKLITFFSFLLIAFGCNSNQLESTEINQLESIEIPNNLELDLDQDGISDFNIVYSQQTEADPTGSFEAVRMNLESSDIDQVLKNEEVFPIFLDEIDIIKTEVASPLYWDITNPSSNIKTPIATIRTDYDATTWNDEWTVFSLEQKETYLIGFKLLGDSNPQVGFIEFSVDSQTGKFTLLKTEFL